MAKLSNDVYDQGLETRGQDDWGSGSFAASRSGKFHKGRDYKAEPGKEILSPIAGRVLRIGWPYANERFRIIEIIDNNSISLWRLFYVLPCVKAGDLIEKGQLIGHCQNISAKYHHPKRRPMKNHVHIECIVDPNLIMSRGEI